MPRATWILFGAGFVNRAGTFVFPFLALYLTDRGEPPTAAGVAVAMYAVGALPSRLAGGLLADRVGRRNTIAISMAGAAVCTLLLWRSSSLPAIYACVIALGMVGDMAWPASKALIADLIPPDLRVTGYTLWRIATNAGWAAGLAIGGFLVERSFDLMFIGDAATSLAFAGVALAFLPHGVRTARHEERELPSARRAILADRGFLAFLLATFLGKGSWHAPLALAGLCFAIAPAAATAANSTLGSRSVSALSSRSRVTDVTGWLGTMAQNS